MAVLPNMNDPFLSLDTVASGSCWDVRRKGTLVAVRLSGAIDDAGSDAWRSIVDGVGPDGVFIDATRATSTTSLSARAALAMTVRKWVARGVRVEVTANEHMTIVCRCVLRVAGAQQVCLAPEAEAQRILKNALAQAAPAAA